jgi:lipopolysaccharide export system permease protein
MLAPLLLTAGAVAVVSFGFNERVVTRATATLKAWEAAEWGGVPAHSSVRSNVYLTDGRNVLAAATISGSGDQITMENVTWYERTEGGMIRQEVRATSATFANPGWQLTDPVRFDIATAVTDRPGPLLVGKGLTADQIELETVDPDTEPFWALSDSIKAYEAVGRRTSELRAKWWHKLSAPLSALLMPLLGSIAAFGLARSGMLFVRAIIGMALGFAYFVVDNAALAMGNFGGYPPFLAAWAPFLLFVLIGETVLVRTEE